MKVMTANFDPELKEDILTRANKKAEAAAEAEAECVYANTHRQHLEEHSFAVAYVAQQLVLRLVDDPKLAMGTYISGVGHDTGKLDPEYQAWVKRVITGVKKGASQDQSLTDGCHIDNGPFTFEDHPRHNEVSLLLYHLLDEPSCRVINSATKDRIGHLLYWHHAKPVRREEFTSLDFVYKKLRKNIGEQRFYDLYVDAQRHIKQVNSLSLRYVGNASLQVVGVKDTLDMEQLQALDRVLQPDYKKYSAANHEIGDYHENVMFNALNNIARAALISADRIVSSLSAEALDKHIEERTLLSLVDRVAPEGVNPGSLRLGEHIRACLDGFEGKYPDSERNLHQSQAAKSLAQMHGVSVLKGPAGCGKTKIALEWAAISGAAKIIWICPRVQVCEGLFHDLTTDDYLPHASIEIFTGVHQAIRKGGVTQPTEAGFEFSGDVVITTVDQILKSIITHSHVTSLIEFMQVHVVFDEYHEYINMPAFNLMFAELVCCKQLSKNNAKTLLVSATPNYFFVENLLQIDREDVIGIDSFNQSRYQIEFVSFDESKQDDSNPLFALQPANSIVISNTATTAQRSFIRNQSRESAVLFHSKFKQSDQSVLFSSILASFCQNGSRNFDVLRSGPVVQAALNITCTNMVTEADSPENSMQRLGRLDRFGENSHINFYRIAVPEPMVRGKCAGPCARFLTKKNSYRSAFAWFVFLQSRLSPVQPEGLTIYRLYQLYDEFYASAEGRKAVELDLIDALKVSVKVINAKVQDPVTFAKTSVKSDQKRLRKSSLRGDSRFVQMAICDVSDQGVARIQDHYACDGAEQTLTMNVDAIEGNDPAGDRNLISFMHQKHHKIMTAKEHKRHTKAYKSYLLKSAAIDAQSPIFVSYAPADLALCNDTQHAHAIVYAISEKQPIGMISVSNLTI